MGAYYLLHKKTFYGVSPLTVAVESLQYQSQTDENAYTHFEFALMMDSFDAIWETLRCGDPGPTVALIDSLVDHGFANAAGGLLRDLVEQMLLAASEIEDPSERKRFSHTIQQVLLSVLRSESEMAELISEVKSDSGSGDIT